MSKLFNTLRDVLTPYANKINSHTEEIEEIQGDVSEVKADLGALDDDVDDLKSALGDFNLGELKPGYFSGKGTINPASENSEVYGENYIPVLPGQRITFAVSLTESKAQWFRFCEYSATKDFIRQYTPDPSQMNTQQRIESVTIPDGVFYIRVSFRSFGAYFVSAILKYNNLTQALSSVGTSLAPSIKYNKNCHFIAHQGYSDDSTDSVTGYNLASSYIDASKHGFDWAEADVKFTRDGIAVCCHDNTFVDGTTGTTITIADTDYSDLIQHDYYGSTISTLEDVVKTCKNYGLTIVIDQLSGLSEQYITNVINIVKKYSMENNVCFILQPNSANIQVLKDAFPTSYFQVLSATATDEDIIATANALKTATNHVFASFNYASHSVDAIQAINALLNDGVESAVWTIPRWIPTCISYMPYVGAITSNKTCYNDVYNYGIT